MGEAQYQSFTATGNLDLGDADPSAVSRWAIQIEDESSMNVSVAFQGRVHEDASYQTLHYVNLADGSVAAAALTAESIILLEASGLQNVRVAVTVTSGTVGIYARPLRG